MGQELKTVTTGPLSRQLDMLQDTGVNRFQLIAHFV